MTGRERLMLPIYLAERTLQRGNLLVSYFRATSQST